jgi:hypothetical protein
VRVRPRWGWLVITVLIALGLSAPLSVPWAIWLNEVRICGHEPVIATDFAAGYSYALPGDPHYYDPGIFPLLTPRYFCTEDEAKAHSYRHAP